MLIHQQELTPLAGKTIHHSTGQDCGTSGHGLITLSPKSLRRNVIWTPRERRCFPEKSESQTRRRRCGAENCLVREQIQRYLKSEEGWDYPPSLSPNAL